MSNRLEKRVLRQQVRADRIANHADPWADWAANNIPIEKPVVWPGGTFLNPPPGVPDVSTYLLKLKKESKLGLADFEGSLRQYLLKQKDIWERDVSDIKPQVAKLQEGIDADYANGLDDKRPAAVTKLERLDHLKRKLNLFEIRLQEVDETVSYTHLTLPTTPYV